MPDAERSPSLQGARSCKGRRGLVMGVANDRSIAWGNRRRLCRSGCEPRLQLPG